MPEYIDKPPHARAKPAYIAIYACRGWDGKPYANAELWTPFVQSLEQVERCTRGSVSAGYPANPALLGITDVAAQVTHLPTP